MVIRPRQLWLLVPFFIGLFFLGAAFAMLQDKHADRQDGLPVIDVQERAWKDRDMIAELIEPMQKGKVPFTVKWNQDWLSGYFQGEGFDLKGKLGGKQVALNRNNQVLNVLIDGKKQDPLLLPYAMYTPYEHAMLIKGHLSSIEPLPIVDQGKPGLLGYQLNLPNEDVREILALWLGPSFPTKETLEKMDRQVSIQYQFWYDSNTKQLRQMVVQLSLDGKNGSKQDQLTFFL
ncbi:MAG TPA: hypothetical protein VE710_16235 [Candidatus Bathyarchaeia archaeon]|nr:hypothetical protein [Candidatus Bathyarchaeia archaeon]